MRTEIKLIFGALKRALTRTFIHYFLHFGFPLILSVVIYKKEWKKAYLIMLTTMLVDLDHLFAHPIFEADRCSIGFHPLHSYLAIGFYIVLLFFKNPHRIIGLGRVLHMATDFLDCTLMEMGY